MSLNSQPSTLNSPQRRTITPQVRILDAKAGLVEYIASDETVDSYREVIRVSGWRFDQFAKNAPFVDSHNYRSIESLLGKVTDFRVEKVGGKPALVEQVQWAKDVPESRLAQIGWRLTETGFLKAVSVGFWPVKWVSRYDQDQAAYQAQLLELGLTGDRAPARAYLEQQQIELSACIIGANPNALAKAYKAGALSDPDLEFLTAVNPVNPVKYVHFLSQQCSPSTPPSQPSPGAAELASHQASLSLLATVVKIAARL